MNINLNLNEEKVKFEYINPGDVFCNGRLAANEAYIKIQDIPSINGVEWNAITAYEGNPVHFSDLADVIHLKDAELNLFKNEREK